jgi:hypothetical protein
VAAQAGAQRRADGAGGSRDQHAIGFGIDHVASFPLYLANSGITSAASNSSVSASFL